MRIITSKQVGIRFLFCPSPIIIDKRSEWGASEDNMQQGPRGAFLKINDDDTVSHLVQPNADFTAPVGWVPSILNKKCKFDKAPIAVDEYEYNIGDVVSLPTIDGHIRYEIKERSHVCYNLNTDGSINEKDAWVQTFKNLDHNYIL